MQLISTLISLVKLGRFQFLLGGVLLHLLGVFIALNNGAMFDPLALLWGQLAITSAQLMTHYANDYFDLEADVYNETPTNWSGGSRVLVDGAIPRHLALWIALTLAAISFSANVVLSLFVVPGIQTFALLLIAQMLAWFYSAPPLQLHSRGMGEFTSMMVVTFLTPLTGYYLQSGQVAWVLLLAVIPLCCFQFAMLLAVEFPDAEGDRQVSKYTLVVRPGAEPAAKLYIGVLAFAYVSLPLLVLAGLPWMAAAGVMLLAPLAAWQVWRMSCGDWRNPAKWNQLAFYTIVLFMGASAAQLGAFILMFGM